MWVECRFLFKVHVFFFRTLVFGSGGFSLSFSLLLFGRAGRGRGAGGGAGGGHGLVKFRRRSFPFHGR